MESLKINNFYLNLSTKQFLNLLLLASKLEEFYIQRELFGKVHCVHQLGLNRLEPRKRNVVPQGIAFKN